ncbi:MAG: hypothetical protein M1828_007524 [Chrysothrix sp. TS-e1954]|nr:MAG: hypothetical protein M1828_007524 [Chrysothrix sp. TS-e1954]
MSLNAILDQFCPDLKEYEQLYRDIHQDPELSCKESKTSEIVYKRLEKLDGIKLHKGIGGHGVVAVIENGAGKTVLLRADMDALPMPEKTGLPYASHKKQVDVYGKEVPVMHSCGHDMHTTVLLAVSSLLHKARDRWAGTLILLFQPSEELASGARAMVKDGLFDKVPRPDILLAQHVHPARTGMVELSPGPILTAVDSLEVIIHGRGGHGARPDTTIDPVLLTCHIIVRLQSITTREVRPGELAVISAGSIIAGETANIIPDEARFKVTIRSYNVELQKRLVDSVKRVIHAECQATGVEKPPEIAEIMHAPSTVNDADLTAELKDSFDRHFGEDSTALVPFAASEDFSELARAIDKPYLFWTFGGTDKEKYDEAARNGTLARLPHNHSPLFAPVIQPTMKTAVRSFAVAAFTFLDENF